MSMVMDGKTEAIKIVAREVGEKAFGVVRQKLVDRHRKDAENSAIRHTIKRQSRSAPHAGRLRGGAEWPPSW
jgi:hypothetical protein